MSRSERRIAHLDMDAFYASVELLRYPELRGMPVVIGGRSAHTPTLQPDGSHHFFRLRDYVGRGVITTSTYEARALGVFSAMGMMKAAQLAPDAILLPVNFDAYRHYSRLFKAAVAEIAPLIEDRGIDEIYIDLSDHIEDSAILGLTIKNAVKAATNLSCSICIAPNKLLAKIGSELEKPDGLTILTEADIPTRIWPLAAKKINGIGPKANQKLAALGIITIADLAAQTPAFLQNHFGPSTALWLSRVAQGWDEREVVTHSEPKSISRETTFERDYHVKHDKDKLTTICDQLCDRVADDLKRKNYVGRTIGIKLKFDDFQTLTRDVTLTLATDQAAVIRQAVGECLKRVKFEKRLRLIGIRVGSLEPKNLFAQEQVLQQTSLSLFD